MKRIVLILLFSVTALHTYAQEKNVFDIARKGSLKEIKTLYAQNPSLINTIDDKKSSPLILACYRGNKDVALFLLDKVKDIDYNSGYGTALMAAVMSGDLEIVSKLIARKANLNLSGTDGKTALHYAVFFNKNDIAKALLDAGASKTLKDQDDRNALDYAKFNKNTALIILLDQ